jgi:hypothetical protein
MAGSTANECVPIFTCEKVQGEHVTSQECISSIRDKVPRTLGTTKSAVASSLYACYNHFIHIFSEVIIYLNFCTCTT